MDKSQSEYHSLSSSATHRITQPSTTLNRKYVKRPIIMKRHNQANSVNEASDTKVVRIGSNPKENTSALSSRLVNMRIRANKPAPEEFDARKFEESRSARSQAEAELEQQQTDFSQSMPQRVFEEVEENYEAVAYPSESIASIPNRPDYTPPVTANIASRPIYQAPIETPPARLTSEMFQPREPQQVHQAVTKPPVDRQVTATDEIDIQFNSPLLNRSFNAEPQPAPTVVTPTATEKVMPAPIKEVLPENANPVSKESLEAIAKAAAAAIASIHNATDPEEVYAEMDKLKTTANKLQSDNQNALTHLQTEIKEAKDEATTLTITTSKSTSPKKKNPNTNITISQPQTHRIIKNTVPKVRTRSNIELPAEEVKRRAVKSAMNPAMQLEAQTKQALSTKKRTKAEIKSQITQVPRPTVKRKHSGRRFVLAFACAAACVATIVSYITTNVPDISVKVAAMQTGIQATYPSYIPREFSLRDVSSQDSRIIMNFDGPDQANFAISEEKSSWDSSALVRNFVEPEWGDEYDTMHEQGITIYVSGSNAAWVNGGVLYKLTASVGALSKKQLRNIVVSF